MISIARAILILAFFDFGEIATTIEDYRTAPFATTPMTASSINWIKVSKIGLIYFKAISRDAYVVL
jgi:hypothetical protein